MVFVIFIIAIIIFSSVLYKTRFSTLNWDSPNWNAKTKQFQHHWKRTRRVIRFKILWKFITSPGPKWPKIIPVKEPGVLKSSDELNITNIGHSTFLIQMSNFNILTDPVFSNRVGPFGIFGPKRVSAPGIPIQSLPPIDTVFISHNHYDHLDKFSVIYLAQHHNVTFIVPLGIKSILLKWGIRRSIIELDWWQIYQYDGLKITSTPAQHWSKRGLFDTNKTLWMGGILETPKGCVFFAGDTGFGPHFLQIAEHVKRPIDVGLLPIGAYKPRFMMKDQHMDPADALSAHQILKTEIMIPFHYDVFPLGKEDFLEAETELMKKAKELNIRKKEIHPLKISESFHLK